MISGDDDVIVIRHVYLQSVGRCYCDTHENFRDNLELCFLRTYLQFPRTIQIVLNVPATKDIINKQNTVNFLKQKH